MSKFPWKEVLLTATLAASAVYFVKETGFVGCENGFMLSGSWSSLSCHIGPLEGEISKGLVPNENQPYWHSLKLRWGDQPIADVTDRRTDDGIFPPQEVVFTVKNREIVLLP